MTLFDLLFPIFRVFVDLQTNETDVISQNNYRLAQELEGKPPMSAQEIKEYVKNK